MAYSLIIADIEEKKIKTAFLASVLLDLIFDLNLL